MSYTLILAMRKMKVIINARVTDSVESKMQNRAFINKGNPNHQLYADGAFNVAPIKIAFAGFNSV